MWPSDEARPTSVRARGSWEREALLADLSAFARPPVARLASRAEVDAARRSSRVSVLAAIPEADSELHRAYEAAAKELRLKFNFSAVRRASRRQRARRGCEHHHRHRRHHTGRRRASYSASGAV